MPDHLRNCPECGRICEGPSALADHALTVHVRAETPAADLRRPGPAWVRRGAGVVGALALPLVIALGLSGAFDKRSAPEQPRSQAHKMAVELRRSGAIDDFRSVEPEAGWDAEYELDDGDGVMRTRDGSTELEYEAFPGDLREEIEKVARRHDFDVGR